MGMPSRTPVFWLGTCPLPGTGSEDKSDEMTATLRVNILGISAFYHDSAACLLRDGEIIAAGSEERFTRIKGDPAFPINAARYCLQEGGISVEDLTFVAFYDKPLLK